MTTYSKKEKLKSRKLIEHLFAQGKSFLDFPFKILYVHPPAMLDFSVKAGVGTSSRNFKRAVDRNRIKRLLREAYRLHKAPLHRWVTDNNKQIAVFILYIDKVLPKNKALQQKMPIVIDRLIKELNETSK